MDHKEDMPKCMMVLTHVIVNQSSMVVVSIMFMMGMMGVIQSRFGIKMEGGKPATALRDTDVSCMLDEGRGAVE